MSRKFKITKPLLNKITKWASNGLTRTDIAYLLGYSKNHWLELMRSNDDLESAYNDGKVEMKSLLQKRVMVKALSDDKDALGASTFLLNRHFPQVDDAEVISDVPSDESIKQEIINDLNS